MATKTLDDARMAVVEALIERMRNYTAGAPFVVTPAEREAFLKAWDDDDKP